MNNLKSKHFRASILSFVPLNKIIANIFNPILYIYRSPYNHQELEWVFCCRAQLRQAATYDILFCDLHENVRF